MDPIETAEQFIALLPKDLGSAKLEMFHFEAESMADAIKTMEPVHILGIIALTPLTKRVKSIR